MTPADMADSSPDVADKRPVALVTGASRRAGIGVAVAERLASDGWDVATTYWTPYDRRMPWGSRALELDEIDARLRQLGAATAAVEADLSQLETPRRIFDDVEAQLGSVTALVLSHCESVNADLVSTTVESFDLHFAVNARASWLLVREFAMRYRSALGHGRIVALTSDHTADNLAYGASKGALDRIVLAAARELGHLAVSANVVNPGPNDTGWMSDDLKRDVARATPSGRIGTPRDAASLVAFLCSERGGWVNGQLLHSDGGIHA